MEDDPRRASATASSQRGDRHQDGDSRQIQQWTDLHAEARIGKDVARSPAHVLQTEPGDGLSGRPSSMPDDLRRTAAAQYAANRIAVDQIAVDQIAVDQVAADQIAVDQVAVSQNGRDRFQRVPAWTAILHLPGAPDAKACHFQTVSAAETPVEVETPGVPPLAEPLAGGGAAV